MRFAILVLTSGLIAACQPGAPDVRELSREEVEWAVVTSLVRLADRHAYAGGSITLACVAGATLGRSSRFVSAGARRIEVTTDADRCKATPGSDLLNSKDGTPAIRVVIQETGQEGTAARVEAHWYEHGTSREDYSCEVRLEEGRVVTECRLIAMA